ncbi:hypothetical protein [Alteromonas macleodii]|uniref:hypothetical protein n=1 Tax=Alteromonas macleodii TaxID=28108 RepID=UPI002FE0AAAE
MQINDAVPERRNLIVFCMATIVFFIGGGDACGEVKLPFGSIVLTNKTGLIFLYWCIFSYLVLRYWSVFKTTAYDPDSKADFAPHKNYMTAIQEAIIRNVSVSSLRFPRTWYALSNKTELSFTEALEKINLSQDVAKAEAIITRQSVHPNKPHSYHLILQIKKERFVQIESEKIKIRSFRYGPIILVSLLKRIFSDKYLFDWVFPWLILLVTLLTIVGASFAFDYSLCPPAPLPPGES